MIPVSARRKKQQGGFALMMIFLMGAIIAIGLYMQVPRAAFESQRAKEEILQERGKEYIRGIQLYVAKNKKFPQSIDDLDKNTPQYHFIRHRYPDPMTGKDEWRIIHTNGMFLTDSIIQQQGQPGTEQKAANTFITEAAAIGSTGSPAGAAVTLATRRRASDNQPMGLPGAQTSVDPNAPQDPNATANAQPGGVNQLNPNYQGQQVVANPNQAGYGQPAGQFGQPGQPGQQSGQQPGQQPGQPVPPGQSGQPGQPVNPNQGLPAWLQPGNRNFPTGSQPGSPLSNQPQGLGSNPVSIGQAPQTANPTYPTTAANSSNPGATPGQPFGGTNPVAQQIMQQLTNPSRQGLAGGQPGGGQMGGGIAGVASKAENDSIKVYNDRQKYNEWEFVYDMKKDSRLTGQQPQGGPPPNSPTGGAPGGGLPGSGGPPRTGMTGR